MPLGPPLNVTLVRALQPIKASEPMEVTSAGMTISVSPDPAKVFDWMLVMLSESVMWVRFLAPANACSAMPPTDWGTMNDLSSRAMG